MKRFGCIGMQNCQPYCQTMSIAFAYNAHGTLGGVSTWARGGSFWSGFASGAVSSFVSSVTEIGCQKLHFSESWTKAALVATGSLSGGVSASMAGGDFWDGVCNGLICAGLNHAMHLAADVRVSKHLANKYVEAARAFLVDMGYDEDQVNQDITVQREGSWGNYYAKMDETAFENHYKTSFTESFDSRNKDFSAYITKERAIHYTNRFGFKTKDSFALKYYPKRSHSIGVVRTGIYHYYEATMEVIDGGVRNWTGKDNVIYDMHGSNADQYLRLRKLYPAQLWK